MTNDECPMTKGGNDDNNDNVEFSVIRASIVLRPSCFVIILHPRCHQHFAGRETQSPLDIRYNLV